jgi:hypothetical protein
VHLGVSDRLLASAGIKIRDSFTIQLCRSECEAIPVLEKVFPAYPNVLGPDCTRCLRQNRKIEAEVLVSFSSKKHAIFDHILNDY